MFGCPPQSNAIYVHLELPEEQLVASDEVALVAVDDNIFRLESFIVSDDVNWGDVIEVIPQSEQTFKFVRVVEKTDWSVYSGNVVGEDFLERPFGQYIIETIEEHGGIWEMKCGGLFDVALPPTCEKTMDELWEECSDNLDLYKLNRFEPKCWKTEPHQEPLDLKSETAQESSQKSILKKIKNFFISTN